jgi:hypothetical protein
MDYNPGHTSILPEWWEVFENKIEDEEFSQDV